MRPFYASQPACSGSTRKPSREQPQPDWRVIIAHRPVSNDKNADCFQPPSVEWFIMELRKYLLNERRGAKPPLSLLCHIRQVQAGPPDLGILIGNVETPASG